MSRFVVVEIGCLECGNPSELLGIYPTLDAAQAAHPDATQRAALGDYDSGDWRGSGLTVIFESGEDT